MKKMTKESIANEVMRLLYAAPVRTSSGSTVVSEALDRIHVALTGRQPFHGMTAHQKTAAILEALDLTYDPHWDTSAGSTVTVRAYSRMLVGLSKTPRCFVLSATDVVADGASDSDQNLYYPYDSTFLGTTSFNEAGPGTLVLFYDEGIGSENPMSYTGTARIEYIAPGWQGPWTAELSGYQEFHTPVRADWAEISNRHIGNVITPISWPEYQGIVAEGTGARPDAHDLEDSLDAGGRRAAERVTTDFPASEMKVVGDLVPARRANGHLEPSPEREPAYTEGPAAEGSVRVPSRPRTTSDRERDKIVEERAVALATQHLANLGWTFVADRQKDGCGYDLEFSDGSRVIHLEVKGIQGPRLEFNLTAKEWWRARTDRDFVLAGVTDVLNPVKANVRLLGPEEILAADRAATQFRIVIKDH
ncbi:DUF3883 domain-containing protein [Promicromonospora sp. NPDC057488]|uniref:DUF3883 domain-containing protein n=1 Tax=Promicromonospora sp. NPDC057488 TaxID=3346147 RepID=UPI00366B88D0